jgi:small-conductance mechanosensitive channel
MALARRAAGDQMQHVARKLLALLLLLCTALGAQAQDAGSPEAERAPESAAVTLRDSPVFSLYRGEGPLSLEARARDASRALAQAAASAEAQPVRWETRGARAVVFAGPAPIVALSIDDVRVAQATSLDSLAAHVTQQVSRALARERQRGSLARVVFSVSLTVFFGLITLYLIGKLRAWCDAARDFLVRNPARVPALRLNRLEVLGSGSVRTSLIITVGVGRRLGMFGLLYAWLVVSLSLFERTRPLVERLTGALLGPFSALLSRVVQALPVFVVLAVAAALIAVLVRVTELFFDSVARGETQLSWVAPELAPATSVMLRGSIVLLALLFGAPILTGDQDAPLSRISMLLLASVALAATPLVTSLLTGMALVFSRRLRLGDRVDYGGQSGRVTDIGLFWVELQDESRARVHVPHLRALWHPTRLHPPEAP